MGVLFALVDKKCTFVDKSMMFVDRRLQVRNYVLSLYYQ